MVANSDVFLSHVQGQYLEAMHCYSACIEALPDQVAGYTNRALCHLRLSSVSGWGRSVGVCGVVCVCCVLCVVWTRETLSFVFLQFALAENDCQRALGLESGNVKALYRRAMARKVSTRPLHFDLTVTCVLG